MCLRHLANTEQWPLVDGRGHGACFKALDQHVSFCTEIHLERPVKSFSEARKYKCGALAFRRMRLVGLWNAQIPAWNFQAGSWHVFTVS